MCRSFQRREILSDNSYCQSGLCLCLTFNYDFTILKAEPDEKYKEFQKWLLWKQLSELCQICTGILEERTYRHKLAWLRAVTSKPNAIETYELGRQRTYSSLEESPIT
jgi:hypothetical protein